MVGRACVNHPYLWRKIDSLLGYEEHKERTLSRGDILNQYIEYCAKFENIHSTNVRQAPMQRSVSAMTAPVYNLFCGEEGSDKFQRVLKRASIQVTSAVTAINAAKLQIPLEVMSSLSAQPISSLVVFEKAPSKTGPSNRRIV